MVQANPALGQRKQAWADYFQNAALVPSREAAERLVCATQCNNDACGYCAEVRIPVANAQPAGSAPAHFAQDFE